MSAKLSVKSGNFMNENNHILRRFVCFFGFTLVFIVSAHSVFAQCANYFKSNYNVINKISIGYPQEPKLDDWTGDGKSDFWNFRLNQSTLRFDVVIYPSKPTGYWDWTAPLVYTTTTFANGVPIDINSDGRMDLIEGDPREMRIHRNTGNGTLVASSVISDTEGFSNVGFFDINGDNLLDWVYTASVPSFSMRYQLQNPEGTFGNKTNIATGFQLFSNAVGDFDGDGRNDIIANVDQNSYVMIKNMGNGTFQVGSARTAEISAFSSLVRDFNNDGKDDVLSRASIFYGQANGTFLPQPLSAVSTSLLPAELNGDGNLDVVEFGTNSYATHINNGAGGFTRTVYPKPFVASGFTTIGWRFEDFNRDGKDDFYDGRTTNPIYNYNAFGEKLLTIKENVCRSSGETKMMDFDDNENADLMMWNPNGGIWSSKNANYTNPEGVLRSFQWRESASSDIPAPGDFDGDGKTDYAVFRNSTGAWYIFRGSDSTLTTMLFGTAGDIAVPNDYDGDGKTDIAVFRPSNGDWYFWSSETQQFLGVHWGTNGDKPVPADYDGDGKTDIGVFRTSSGYWYYLKSSDGSFFSQQWGISTDKPVPADYDGDGKADLAVYRNGTWWLVRSVDNSAIGVQWGSAGDVPVPVYRNSINADFTVYRPSNNTWRGYENRNTQLSITFGTSQDTPIHFGLPNN